MACNCDIHRGTNLTTAGVLTVTNPNNISNFDDFGLVICLNPNNIITTAPVPYQITVNGANVPVLDVWGFQSRQTDCARVNYTEENMCLAQG